MVENESEPVTARAHTKEARRQGVGSQGAPLALVSNATSKACGLYCIGSVREFGGSGRH